MRKFVIGLLLSSLLVFCKGVDLRVFDGEERPISNVNGCQCQGYSCGCCQHLEVDKIGLNDTGCINVTYLEQEYGFRFTLSIDGHVYINKTISAKNPPPVCAEIPHLRQLASLCIQFYNLSFSSSSFSGCVKILAKLKYIIVEEIDIGCFKIPPKVPMSQGILKYKPRQVYSTSLSQQKKHEGILFHIEEMFRSMQAIDLPHNRKSRILTNGQ